MRDAEFCLRPSCSAIKTVTFVSTFRKGTPAHSTTRGIPLESIAACLETRREKSEGEKTKDTGSPVVDRELIIPATDRTPDADDRASIRYAIRLTLPDMFAE